MKRAFFCAATVLTALPPGIASAGTAQSNLAITGHQGAAPIIKLHRTKPPVTPPPS